MCAPRHGGKKSGPGLKVSKKNCHMKTLQSNNQYDYGPNWMELFITIHKQKDSNFLIYLEFSIHFVCKHHLLTFPAPCRWSGMDTFLLADSLLNVFFTLLLLFWDGFLVKFSFLVPSSNSSSFFSFLTSSSGVSWLIPCSACLSSPPCWKKNSDNLSFMILTELLQNTSKKLKRMSE